ncbi:MAG: helix-turn-helix transcriptional regulator [Gemmatimonadaceae bacterium]
MTKETLGQAIRRLRLQAGSGLRAFANKIEVSAAYLSDVEHDRRVPTTETLQAIVGELVKDVPVTYEELRDLSTRLETDLQRMVQQHPEVGQLLREVKQTGRPARDVIRELQEHLRDLRTETEDKS